jgi:hypothetical protein
MDSLRGEQGNLDFYLQEVALKSEEPLNTPILVLSQGFILGARPTSLHEQGVEAAQRVSTLTGWPVLSYWPSGVGESEGVFSVDGALKDVNCVIRSVRGLYPSREVVFVGFDVMGSVFLAAAVSSDEISGVVVVGSDIGPRGLIDPNSLLSRLSLSSVRLASGYNLEKLTEDVEKVESKGRNAFGRMPILVIVTTKRYRSRVDVFATDIVSNKKTEIHSFLTDDVSLRYDPQLYAVLAGWLDRNF